MKKLLSLLLAAALALSLSVSALAYEDLEPPLWQRWGYDSLEEYLTDWDETEEEYAQEIVEYIAERAAEDALIATYDPEAHDFTPALWEYYGYDSKAEMLEDWGMDEADYARAVDEQLFGYESRDWTAEQWEAYSEAQEAAWLADRKAALGLADYDINVMVDGAAVDFGNYPPEIVNGRTMIRALDQTDAGYDAETGTVTVAKDGVTLAFTVGGDRLAVTKNGETAEVTLDVAPYLKDGAVYVPLRAAAKALGYDVLWSETFRTAVLVDKDTVVAEFDKNFSVLNAILAMGADLDREQTYRGEGKLDLKVTMFDSINGDKTFTGSVSAAVVQNGHAVQGTVSYDVEGLLGLLALLGVDPTDMEDAELSEMGAVLSALDDGIEMIVSLDSGKIYLRGALFAAAYGVGDTDGGTWFSLDFGTLMGLDGFAELTSLEQGTYTVGELVYLMSSLGGTDPVYLAEMLDETAEALAMLDDSHFTASGNTRHFESALPGDGEGSVTLDVVLDGEKAERLTGTVVYGEEDQQFRCEFALSTLEERISGSFHVKNTVLVEFELTAESAPAPGVEVPSAPPAGAEVLDLFDLFAVSPDSSAGIIGGADGPTAIFIAA